MTASLVRCGVWRAKAATPEPMYEIDAVCADRRHPAVDGCFRSANPDADRRWPSDDFFWSLTANLVPAVRGFARRSVDTSTACKPPYQLIRLYEERRKTCKRRSLPLQPLGRRGHQWPWPQFWTGRTPREKPTDTRVLTSITWTAATTRESVTIFPAAYAACSPR